MCFMGELGSTKGHGKESTFWTCTCGKTFCPAKAQTIPGNILALVKIMFLVPIHTAADPKRNFLLAGRVKTDWRNRLHSARVSDLMMLSLSSRSVDSFKQRENDRTLDVIFQQKTKITCTAWPTDQT